MRESWTDDRLDDFRGETARRLDGIDGRLGGIDGRLDKIDARFEKVDERFERLEGKIDRKFERIDERLDVLAQAMGTLSFRMTQFGVGIVITLVIGFLSLS